MRSKKLTLVLHHVVFAGAVVSLCSLPPITGQSPHLITASAEKLLRLHSMPTNSNLLSKTKENGKINSVQFHPKGIKTLVWDGKVPSSLAGDLNKEADGTLKPVNDVLDDVWGNMATVEDEEQEEGREEEHRHQRRRPH